MLGRHARIRRRSRIRSRPPTCQARPVCGTLEAPGSSSSPGRFHARRAAVPQAGAQDGPGHLCGTLRGGDLGLHGLPVNRPSTAERTRCLGSGANWIHLRCLPLTSGGHARERAGLPRSQSERGFLAHEYFHVLQQREGSVPVAGNAWPDWGVGGSAVLRTRPRQ